MSGPSSPSLHWSALWGIAGVLLILGQAVWRLSARAAEALSSDLTAVQWAVLVVVVAFMAYSEGYKGFQKAFAPRAAVRALAAQRRGWAAQVFAPLFCMALFDATKKRKIVSYCLFTGIVILIIAVRLLPMPWRGIVDAGVVVGLGWGMLALVAMFVRAAGGGLRDVSAELAP